MMNIIIYDFPDGGQKFSLIFVFVVLREFVFRVLQKLITSL